MYESEMMQIYPARRVKAYDGMAVTAAVWDTAHDFHRQLLEVHTSFAHGYGVLYGLEVIAGEPPDRQIYIQPGIAIDGLGRTIILPEQRAYDLRAAEGTIYVVLTYGESAPRSDTAQSGDDAPRFVYSEFVLEALLGLPSTPYVELARINRQGAGAAVSNAVNPDLPGVNEIDTRNRMQLQPNQPRIVHVGVVSTNGKATTQLQGMLNLAHYLKRSETRVAVDAVALNRGILAYDMIYLVGQEPFALNAEQTGLLNAFYQQGGTIYYESERSAGADDTVDASFRELVTTIGVTLTPANESFPLLRTPNYFPSAPDGFETTGSPRLMVTDGVIFSGFDYGGIWQGKRRGRTASRGEVRSAFEFGENLITLVLDRRNRFAVVR